MPLGLDDMVCIFQVHGFVHGKYKKCDVKSSALCQAFQGDQHHKRVNAEQRATHPGRRASKAYGIMFLACFCLAGSVAA